MPTYLILHGFLVIGIPNRSRPPRPISAMGGTVGERDRLRAGFDYILLRRAIEKPLNTLLAGGTTDGRFRSN